MELLVAFLIFLVVLVVITAIVVFILQKLAVPPLFINIVYAVAGIILLIWILQHLAGIEHAF